jgi:hypothetical protein
LKLALILRRVCGNDIANCIMSALFVLYIHNFEFIVPYKFVGVGINLAFCYELAATAESFAMLSS